MTPFLLVLSSPSGGGKTTIARRLLEARTDVGYSVSATTRSRRPGEIDGKDYFFLDRAEFERRVAQNEFVEHATYNGDLYGTLLAEVERIFVQGKHVVLDIEVEGARQVRRRFPDAVLVFVFPPSGRTLVARLKNRRTEHPTALKGRMERAAEEFLAVEQYDYAIVNDDLNTALAHVSAILDAENWRVGRMDGLTRLVELLRKEVLAEAARLAE